MENDESKYKNFLNEFDKPDYNDWVEVAEQSLKGKHVSEIVSKSLENIEIKPIYLSDEKRFELIDFPAQFPFRRAKNIMSYKIEPWQVVQKLRFKNFNNLNTNAKHFIAGGVTGLKIKFGKNPEFKTLEDLDAAFNGIDMNNISLFFSRVYDENLLSLLLEYSNKNSCDLKGSINYDFISDSVKNGGFEIDHSFLFKKLANQIKLNSFNNFTTFSVDSGVYCEAGCTKVQELAYILATVVEYLRNLMNEGIDLEVIIKNLMVHLSTGSDFFMEIAKFRAIRILLANIIKSFNNDLGILPKFYIKSLMLNKSNLDNYVNHLRNTIETLSAIIGGVDAIELIPFDDSSSESSEFSERITRNIQNVLKEECNITDVIDPAGGSYFIEALTDDLAKKSWELFQLIESKGGMIKYLKSGEPQNEIEKIQIIRIKNINTRKDILLGTNKYPNLSDNFKELKKSKYNKEITVSEPIQALKPFRLSQKFEKMRTFSFKYMQKFNHYPQIFIAGMGPLRQHKARVDFAMDFFHVGGFETIYRNGYNSVDEAIRDYIETVSNVIVICSKDDTYPDIVPEFCEKALSVKAPTILYVAGYPTENIEKYSKYGIYDFIHLKANIFEILVKLQKMLVIPAICEECVGC